MSDPQTAGSKPETVVRAFYDALAKADGAAALGLLAPEISWLEAERFPYYSGVWRTPQEVAEKLLARLGADWDDFSAVADDFIGAGDQVVAFGRYRGRNRASGRQLDAAFAHRWTVRDSRITGFVMYTDTAKVLEAMAS